MIVYMFFLIVVSLCGCGGSSTGAESSFEDEAGGKGYVKKVLPKTGFYKSNALTKRAFDKLPESSEDDIVYLLKKDGENTSVIVKIALPMSSSSSDFDGSSNESQIDDADPIWKNEYCVMKIGIEKCIKNFEFDYDDIENGFLEGTFEIDEGFPGEPIFYGLYTYNRETENKKTKLSELHVYTYYEDTYKVNVIHVGERFFFNGNLKSESEKVFDPVAISVDYTQTEYELKNEVDGGYLKESQYGIDGSYLAVRGCKKELCYGFMEDDIDLILSSIQDQAWNEYGTRAAIALGLPTRKYWTFQESPWSWEDYEVCYDYNDEIIPKQQTVYQITSLYSTDEYECDGFGTDGKYLFATKLNDDWYFKKQNNSSIPKLDFADWKKGQLRDFVNPECDVLMESASSITNQYLDSHLDNALGIMVPIPDVSVSSPYDFKALVTLNRYNAKGGGRTALHEIGHLLGLYDIEDPYYNDKTEGSLMHYKSTGIGSMIRGRKMSIHKESGKEYSSVNGSEFQWDCLHRISEGSCADNSYNEFDVGSYMKSSDYSFK